MDATGAEMRAVSRVRRVAGRARRRLTARRDPTGAGRSTPPRPRTAVVVAHADAADAVRRRLRRLASDEVTLLRLGDRPVLEGRTGRGVPEVPVGSLGEVESHLVRTGPVDLVVVAVPASAAAATGTDLYSLHLRSFLHLRPGGRSLVLRDPRQEPAARSRGPFIGAPDVDRLGTGRWHRLLLTAAEEKGTGRRTGRLSRLEAEVVHSTESMSVDRTRIEMTKRGRHLVKLREHEVTELLPVREPRTRVTVVGVLPAGTLDVRLTETQHGRHRTPPWPDRLPHPQLQLRHYEGSLVSAGGMRLYAGDTVLPESFRWPLSERLDNPWIRSADARLAEVPTSPARVTLEGPHLHLDCVFTGHFGHLMTEVVARLWAWDTAKALLPELKALVHVKPQVGKHGALERQLLTAYGVPAEDIVTSPVPVRLRQVVGASPMWHNHEPYYVHPAIRETWARLSNGLVVDPPAGPERIFVSRSDAYDHRRGCRNREEVEELFRAHGYHVVYPETLSLQQQAAVFARARVVAGFGGSAMANLIHTRQLEAVVVLSQQAYRARNEHLLTSVLGGDLHYFRSDSDAPAHRDSPHRPAVRASWAFDFAGLGDALTQVLRQL